MSDEDSTAEAAQLVEILRKVLAYREPEVVGAVLGQLLAILIAGHCPEMRAEAMKLVIDMANDLIPIEIDEMISNGQVSEDWRGTKQ